MTDKTDKAIPKLVDFGLVKIIGPGEGASECLGTAAYACPEILCHTFYDQSADVWSLGVIYYVLLSGTLPY